jgi:hypothetical protein
MKALRRLTLFAALALCLALPGIGSDGEGGENAGGTGVWILPRANFLAAGELECRSEAPRATMSFASANTNVAITTSTELGDFSAVLVDPISGIPVSLTKSGSDVLVPAELLKQLCEVGCQVADIVITDAQQLGYVIAIEFDQATGQVSMKAY